MTKTGSITRTVLAAALLFTWILTPDSALVHAQEGGTDTGTQQPAETSYTLTYDANGLSADNFPEAVQVSASQADILLSNLVPSCGGYDFICWNTAADGSGTEYQPAAAFTVTENQVLYAQWKPTDSSTGTLQQSLSTEYNGFTIRITGSFPADASISVQGIDEKETRTKIFQASGSCYMVDVMLAVRLTVKSGETEYQPEGADSAYQITVSSSNTDAFAQTTGIMVQAYQVAEDQASLLDSRISEDKTQMEFTVPDFTAIGIATLTDLKTVASKGYEVMPSDYNTDTVQDNKVQTFSNQNSFLSLKAAAPSYIPDIKTDIPVVRNQAIYGNCWAYSTIGLAEMSLLKQGRVTTAVDLSELHLSYFTYNSNRNDTADPLGGTKGDVTTYTGTSVLNNGGNLNASSQTLLNWSGIAQEKDIPYADAGSVNTNGLSTDKQYSMNAYHLQDVYQVNIKTNPELVKEYIKQYGGAGISFFANLGSSDGSVKYYSTTNNAYYCPDKKSADHAVMVVGWDDTFSKDKFDNSGAIPAANGAWLVRNSWGTNDYGYSGYFWLSYADTSLTDTAYILVAEPADNYDNNYQYDSSMNVGSSISISNDIFVANIFTAAGNSHGQELLKAVSFSTETANVNYKINIYKNVVKTEGPESGTSVSTVNGSTTAAGTYTIPLSTQVSLSEGDIFSVVVELSNDTDEVTVGTESAYNGGDWTAVVSASADQSYIRSGESSDWVDYGAEYKENIRVKAFTDDVSTAVLSGTVSSFDSNDVEKVYLYSSDATESAIETDIRKSAPEQAVYQADLADSSLLSGRTRRKFFFSQVTAGSYKLAIYQAGKHVVKIMPVVVTTTPQDIGELKVWLYGDVNDDGDIGTADGFAVLRYTAGQKSAFTTVTDNDQWKAANINLDLNFDGTPVIDTADGFGILRSSAGQKSAINNLPN